MEPNAFGSPETRAQVGARGGPAGPEGCLESNQGPRRLEVFHAPPSALPGVARKKRRDPAENWGILCAPSSSSRALVTLRLGFLLPPAEPPRRRVAPPPSAPTLRLPARRAHSLAGRGSRGASRRGAAPAAPLQRARQGAREPRSEGRKGELGLQSRAWLGRRRPRAPSFGGER